MGGKPKLNGSVILREGITSPPAKPLIGTDIDHIPNYGDNSAHDAVLNLNLVQEFEKLRATTSVTGQYSVLNSGVSGEGLEGTASRVTGELTLGPKQGSISSVYLWNTQKSFDIKNGPEIDLNSYGGYVEAKPVSISDNANIILGVGARFGSLDPQIAQATAKLTSGKIFTEVGYVHSLGDENNQAFAGVGFNGEKTSAHLRQYFDVSGNNSTDNTRTQLSVSQKLSEATSLYGYGTISEGEGLRLQEVMAGVRHQINKSTSFFAEGGVTTGIDPKADLAPSTQAGIRIDF